MSINWISSIYFLILFFNNSHLLYVSANIIISSWEVSPLAMDVDILFQVWLKSVLWLCSNFYIIRCWKHIITISQVFFQVCPNRPSVSLEDFSRRRWKLFQNVTKLFIKIMTTTTDNGQCSTRKTQLSLRLGWTCKKILKVNPHVWFHI